MLRKRLWIGVALIVVLLVAVAVVFAASAWNDVKRVTIDRSAVGLVAATPQPEGGPAPEVRSDGKVTVPPSGDGLDVFLLVGSDSRASLDDLNGFGNIGGERADVVMVLLKPRDGTDAAVLSLPRDLLVANICGGDERRLNEALFGCGNTLNGPTTLLLTVETLTGVTVDHFALVDLAGFQDAVDAVGGYEICLDRPVRDRRAKLDLPAGCTHASGAQTLAWLRSRHTQELTESGWRTVPGVNDLTRNERQRKFMISMMSRLSDLTSPDDIGVLAKAVAPYVTVDSGLGFMDAVGLAWTMRGLETNSVMTLEIPVADAVTPEGASVLVATADVASIVDSYLHPVTTGNADILVSS